MSIGSRLKTAISSSGESVNHVAKEAGILQQVLQRFMSGKRDNLRLDTLEKLFQYLEIGLLAPGEVAVPSDQQTLIRQKLEIALGGLTAVRDFGVKLRLRPHSARELWRRLATIEEAIDEISALTTELD